MMLYAIEFAGAGPTVNPRALAELAKLAEDAGWDGVFLEDYIVHHTRRDMPTCDPWVALAAMALSTSTVRLGTEVTPLPRRRPWKLAREVATLDHLSNGRMILGAGLGDANDPGFGGVGEPTAVRTRAELLDESLAIIAGLWTGQPFSFSGRHYHVDEMTFLPRPVQAPRVPIWIGGGWPNPGVKKRASRWDGICAYMEMGTFEEWKDQSPDYVTEVRALIEQERGSDDDFAIVTGGRDRDDDWDRERDIIAGLDEAGATWWVEYAPADLDLDQQREIAVRGPLRPS
jgi:alkanesulfonate monooxygenase SsuD/methylene tetrahydromethanopterin reductase-like flavin-dependent oxidoreductase (luciferase family)